MSLQPVLACWILVVVAGLEDAPCPSDDNTKCGARAAKSMSMLQMATKRYNVTIDRATPSCINDVNFGDKKIKLGICYDTAWGAGARKAVFTWQHGSSALTGHQAVVPMGFIGIALPHEFGSCNYKVGRAIKWLQANGNNLLKNKKVEFSFSGDFYTVGYSRAGICAAGAGLVKGKPAAGLKGAIALGAFRWIPNGSVNLATKSGPKFLTFNCGPQDYPGAVKKRLAKLKEKTSGTQNVVWNDCNHVSYKKHKAEILNKMKTFIR